jgi:hypothetical protein
VLRTSGGTGRKRLDRTPHAHATPHTSSYLCARLCRYTRDVLSDW